MIIGDGLPSNIDDCIDYSNKIEGSTLSEQHTASLFKTESLKANGEIIRAKDVEEMKIGMFYDIDEIFLILLYRYDGVFRNIVW